MIIGMSEDCDDSIRRRALLSGADHFLPKPFTVQKLVAAVLQSRAEEFRGLESLRDDYRGLESLGDDLGSCSSTLIQAAEPTMP